MSRKLSKDFINELQAGFLSALKETIIADKDLDLQIRENYLNIYYKGNSLLKLTERGKGGYEVDVHPKFAEGLEVHDLVDQATTENFIKIIPSLKENIISFGKKTLEIEYEQLIVRANNLERRNNSDYFIVDRQYVAKDVSKNQFDLTGFYWKAEGRRKGNKVPLCLMEVKFALNPDIKDIHNQISRYYDSLSTRMEDFAGETQTIFRQKLALGLVGQEKNRTVTLNTLEFSSDIEQLQFILVLVDYNPRSSLFDPDKLRALHFADQIKVFQTGFAIWEDKLTPICGFNDN